MALCHDSRLQKPAASLLVWPARYGQQIQHCCFHSRLPFLHDFWLEVPWRARSFRTIIFLNKAELLLFSFLLDLGVYMHRSGLQSESWINITFRFWYIFITLLFVFPMLPKLTIWKGRCFTLVTLLPGLASSYFSFLKCFFCSSLVFQEAHDFSPSWRRKRCWAIYLRVKGISWLSHICTPAILTIVGPVL